MLEHLLAALMLLGLLLSWRLIHKAAHWPANT
jgi:hypothetical protein